MECAEHPQVDLFSPRVKGIILLWDIHAGSAKGRDGHLAFWGNCLNHKPDGARQKTRKDHTDHNPNGY